MLTNHSNLSLPCFNAIVPEKISAQLTEILENNRRILSNFLKNPPPEGWELMQCLEELDNTLSLFWDPINHLAAVKQTPELRTAYKACLPLLSEYSAELMQNKQLYTAIHTLFKSEKFKQFDYAQKKAIENELKSFHLSGVDLTSLQQEDYRRIHKKLGELTALFEENILDATHAWSLTIEDESQLQGLPVFAKAQAKKNADQKKLTGWLLTLDHPSYLAAITYLDNRKLREILYKAYVTRASELGDPKFDNSKIIFQILELRHELSQLLGYANFAELSLASDKMAKNPEAVLNFLEKLIAPAKAKAERDLRELLVFTKNQDLSIETLEAWDIAYYSEKLIHQTFGINEEILRAYFPLDKVLNGLFNLVEKLYNISVKEKADVELWDQSVRFFEVYDEKNYLRGQFYIDFFARTNKREGAWMDDCRARLRLANGKLQTPIAFLIMNFSPSKLENLSLLTHEEVLTLFHEFGHGLQHILTKIDYSSVSGINGVDWDAVEIPSQFHENFVWEKEVLDQLSDHYQTHEHLPANLIGQLRDSKNFQSGLFLCRQLELALFDFRLHLTFNPSQRYEQIQTLLDNIRSSLNPLSVPVFNRFQHSFSHIFAGGYAAGYYSYLWAEVLAIDAFSLFQQQDLFNKELGKRFLHTFLEEGGAIDALVLFEKFRQSSPQLTAFLNSGGFLTP